MIIIPAVVSDGGVVVITLIAHRSSSLIIDHHRYSDTDRVVFVVVVVVVVIVVVAVVILSSPIVTMVMTTTINDIPTFSFTRSPSGDSTPTVCTLRPCWRPALKATKAPRALKTGSKARTSGTTGTTTDIQRPVYSVAAPPPAGARARALVRPLRLCLLLLQCARPASARPSPASLRFTTAVLGVGRGLRLRLGLVRRGGPGLCGGRGGHADLASMWRRRRRRPGGFGRVGVKKGVLGGLHLLEHLIPVVRGVFVI